MLSPEQIEAVANDITRIYSETESACIESIVKRIVADADISSVSAWQLKKLNEVGLLRTELIREISKQSKKSLPEIQALVEHTLRTSYARDTSILKKITYTEAFELATQSKAFKNAVNSAIRSIVNSLNVTNTRALQSALNLYSQAINTAYYNVELSLMPFDKAIRKAVTTIGRSGIKLTEQRPVDPLDSGRPLYLENGNTFSTYATNVIYPLDASVRRDVVTQLNQSSGTLTLDNCEDLNCTLVETTQHLGARPEHALWQGKVFSLDPNNDKYPYFYAPQEDGGTGYGTITGLLGINCYHSFFPYIEGSPKKEDEKINPEENAKAYAQQQQQREFERKLRYLKRWQNAERASGYRDQAEKVQAKINTAQAEYKKFLKETGRTRVSMLDQISGYHPIKVHS